MKNTLKPKSRKISLAFLMLITGSLLKSAHCQDYGDFFSNNGSFEFGSSPPPLSFPSSNSSLNTITGWRMSAQGIEPRWLEDVNAQDGSRYIRLRSTGGAGAGESAAVVDGTLISHTPFTIGEAYELAFWAAGGPAANNNLLVVLNQPYASLQIPAYTQAEFDALAGLEWAKYTVPFTATDPTMYFGVVSPASTQGGYQSIVYLDNFSIIGVPEPGSALLVMGAGLVLGRWRKRSACGRS